MAAQLSRQEMNDLSMQLCLQFEDQNKALIDYEDSVMSTIKTTSDEELRETFQRLLEEDEWYKALKAMKEELYIRCCLANRAGDDVISLE